VRIAFIHGINNESQTADTIRSSWQASLESAWEKLNLRRPDPPVIDVAYYARTLATASIRSNDAGTAMGTGAASTSDAINLLRAYAEAANVTETELAAAADRQGVPREAVEQGVPHEGWVIAFAGLLEAILPDKGLFVANHFLRQAAVYISNKALAARVDAEVEAQVFDNRPDPTIIVAHSLGTVIAYRLLAGRRMENRAAPLFITLGSPLSVSMFRPILPTRGIMPTPPIARWINGRHADDFVTLGRAITKQSIGFDGVVDVTDIDNPDNDKHSILRYLASPPIARELFRAAWP
jgi:hypothetical protein